MNIFIVGEDIEANLRDRLMFICSQCGKDRHYCNCYPKPSQIPVIVSQDSLVYDVNLR